MSHDRQRSIAGGSGQHHADDVPVRRDAALTLGARTLWSIAASALIALAAWPAFVRNAPSAVNAADPIALATAAPVTPDYEGRDREIAFLESRYKKDPVDMITPWRLSSAYLQRYRERADIGDVVRAQAAAQTSLAILPPARNPVGDLALANAEVTLHRFRAAKVLVAAARRARGNPPDLALEEAGVDLELGDYAAAQRLIEQNRGRASVPSDVVVARWDEQSGHLDDAVPLLERAMHYADSIFDVSAERRAWYHFRLGELRYLRGDNSGAIAAERDALAIYPADVNAWQALARFELATKAFDAAQADAEHAASIVPSPETLGILADAQAARGERAAAGATLAQFDAVERIGNAQHVNDRLIALYLADHGRRTADAYAIARRERAVRDDIYTEDTLAWCAAADGRWEQARIAIAKAVRFDTQDPRIQYHAGVIAQQAGDAAQARRRFERALELNPAFSATAADDARRRLAALPPKG